MLRKRRWPLLAAVVVVVGGLLGGAATIRASEPATQDVTVPAAGQSSTITWSGTLLSGSNATSDCSSLPDQSPMIDHHGVTIHVPSTGYSGFKTTFTFKIAWQPSNPTGLEDANDEVLTVVSKEGDDADSAETREIGSSDGSDTTETVVATDLPPGDYDVEACGFVNSTPQPYTGTLTVASEALSASASLPSADAQGLQFSAAVPADPQRDEAEPLIVSDKNGLLYTCGPTGFSNGADYAQVSTDGGDQFHLLGTPPRGQQSDGGGGDCVVATGEQPNAQGNYQYAYAGLGALSGFATSTSPDNGHTLTAAGGDTAGGVTTNGALADRQWMTFVDDHTVLLTYNQQEPRNAVVVTSTDGGLNYGLSSSIAAPNPDFPGPMHYIASSHTVVMPWTKGESVNLAISTDAGQTWTDCNVAKGATAAGGTAGFATADVDAAGNVYVAWADKADYHTWLASIPAASLAGCDQPTGNSLTSSPGDGTVAGTTDGIPTVSAGANAPVQVDRDAVRTTVFPWVAAGGAPGRVAVAFYGTTVDGDPNVGSFKAAWNVYVSQSVNALDSGATFAQVQATTHPFHYDSICLNGLGCDLSTPAGDRSLADFFAITYDRKDGRLSVVFNRTNKKPDDAAGYVAAPMVTTQIAGPSNGGGTVDVTGRGVVRTSTADPTGDALYPYSSLGATPSPQNLAAGDFTGASVGPDPATNGVTVTLRLADLSSAALAQAAGAGSLVWIWRFTNGLQDAAAVAKWSTATGFSYGFDDYTTDSGTCAGTGGKCEIYPGSTPIAGSADQAAGTITLTIPASLLHPLSGTPDQYGRPAQGQASVGSRFYDGTAFSFRNDSADPATQSWMAQLDNTPAFDFLLQAAPASTGGGGGSSSGGGGGSSSGGGGGGGSSGGGGGAPTTTAGTPPPAPPASTRPPTTTTTPAGGVKGATHSTRHLVRGFGIVGSGRVARASFTLDLRKGPGHKVVFRDGRLRFRSLRVTSVRVHGHAARLAGVGLANGRHVRFAAVAVDHGTHGDVFRVAWGGGPSHGGVVARGGLTVR